MALTDKQKKVIDFCFKNGNEITKTQAMDLIDDHYCNGSKHVGEVLSRMVNAGLLIRVKPGKFTLGKGSKSKTIPVPENQTDLFKTTTL